MVPPPATPAPKTRYSAGEPNYPEGPNISVETNPAGEAADRAIASTIDEVVERYDAMMRRLLVGHAPEFIEVGITMAQAKVLYLVLAAGRLRMSELAARLGTGVSSASEVVERLVELGLLDRVTDVTDRRHVVVTVTGPGTALLERFRELNERQLRELLSRLDPTELSIVHAALDALHRAIDRSTADQGDQTT